MVLIPVLCPQGEEKQTRFLSPAPPISAGQRRVAGHEEAERKALGRRGLAQALGTHASARISLNSRLILFQVSPAFLSLEGLGA